MEKLLNIIFDPDWKPLFWKLYWQYCPYETYIASHGTPKIERQFCKEGNFYYDFEDDLYYYKMAGKTRKLIHRIPKRFSMMVNRKLYEKTPSELTKKRRCEGTTR